MIHNKLGLELLPLCFGVLLAFNLFSLAVRDKFTLLNKVYPACPIYPVKSFCLYLTGMKYLPSKMPALWNTKYIPLGRSLFYNGEGHFIWVKFLPLETNLFLLFNWGVLVRRRLGGFNWR
jgi:hypothetical protein